MYTEKRLQLCKIVVWKILEWFTRYKASSPNHALISLTFAMQAYMMFEITTCHTQFSVKTHHLELVSPNAAESRNEFFYGLSQVQQTEFCCTISFGAPTLTSHKDGHRKLQAQLELTVVIVNMWCVWFIWGSFIYFVPDFMRLCMYLYAHPYLTRHQVTCGEGVSVRFEIGFFLLFEICDLNFVFFEILR